MFNTHFSSMDIYNVTLALGTIASIIMAVRSKRLKALWLAFRVKGSRAWSIQKMIGDLTAVTDSQRETVESSRIASEEALKAVQAMQAGVAIQEGRLRNLENANRNLMFYYNLVLNYCTRLLDHILVLRGYIAQHEPSIVLPDIPVRPEHLNKARNQYQADIDIEMIPCPPEENNHV